jgi:hypothetical protein
MLNTLSAYFPVPPAPVPGPPGPVATPSPRTTYADFLDRLSFALDDPERVRSPDAVLLRALGRAAQWVALRHRLLIQTFPLVLVPQVPWYHLPTVLPQVVLMTDVATATGVPLRPVPMSRLRYVDRTWLHSTGPLARYYRVGWTYVGFAPVPAVATTVAVTGLVVPAPAVQSPDALDGVSGYEDAVIQVATGLLLCGRERTCQEGLARIAEGLEVQTTQPTAAGAGGAG